MHQLNIGIVVAMGAMWVGILVIAFRSTATADRGEIPNQGFFFWRVGSLNCLHSFAGQNGGRFKPNLHPPGQLQISFHVRSGLVWHFVGFLVVANGFLSLYW
jgi:hypothetical protein